MLLRTSTPVQCMLSQLNSGKHLHTTVYSEVAGTAYFTRILPAVNARQGTSLTLNHRFRYGLQSFSFIRRVVGPWIGAFFSGSTVSWHNLRVPFPKFLSACYAAQTPNSCPKTFTQYTGVAQHQLETLRLFWATGLLFHWYHPFVIIPHFSARRYCACWQSSLPWTSLDFTSNIYFRTIFTYSNLSCFI